MAFSRKALFLFALTLAGSAVFAQLRIAGYDAVSDVREHSEIDLDQEIMEDETDNGQWSDAEAVYANGKNSDKSDSKRTLKGFSTTAAEKMANQGYFELFRAYWNAPDYADVFVTDALNGRGDFSGKSIKFRGETANKGSQYQNVWMYVIHEMEDAINDCRAGDLEDNDKGVKAWDEAWAFWVGSLVGSTNAKANDGKLGYTLAHKRSANFGTANADGVANVNAKMLEFFNQGKQQLEGGNCDDAIETKNQIAVQMTIPVVQGILRYVTQVTDGVRDQEEGAISVDDLGKLHGEGWAFSAAALPIINHCSEDVAQRLVRNFEPKADPPMSDSVEDVTKALQSVYKCMGFTCGDVGDQDDERQQGCELSGEDFKPIPGTERASGDEDDGGLSGGAIAGIVIAVLFVVAAVFFFFILKRRSRKGVGLPTAADTAVPMEA